MACNSNRNNIITKVVIIVINTFLSYFIKIFIFQSVNYLKIYNSIVYK